MGEREVLSASERDKTIQIDLAWKNINIMRENEDYVIIQIGTC